MNGSQNKRVAETGKGREKLLKNAWTWIIASQKAKELGYVRPGKAGPWTSACMCELLIPYFGTERRANGRLADELARMERIDTRRQSRRLEIGVFVAAF